MRELLPTYILLLPAIPIGIWIAWTDIKYMRIRNEACYALFISFLIMGPLIFDLNEYGIRITQGFVMLFLGFIGTSLGLSGGGDAKFAAAMAPYIALSQIMPFLFILAIISIISLVLHRLIGVTPGLRSLINDLDSWNEHKMFPYGVILAGSLITYLTVNIWLS